MAKIQLPLEKFWTQRFSSADVAQYRDYCILFSSVDLLFLFFGFENKIKQRRVEKTIDAPVKRRDSTYPPTKKKKTVVARGVVHLNFKKRIKKNIFIFISGF